MRLLIDMDEIVVDLLDTWLDIYNREWNDNVKRHQVRGWAVHEYIKPECGVEVYEILERRGLFDHLPAMPGAVEAITNLHHDGHEIRFVTSTPSADAGKGKIEWIRREFSHLNYSEKHVFQMHDKVWLAPVADVMIDDKPTTIEAWRKYADEADDRGEISPRIFTIRHPHNTEECKYAHYVGEDYSTPALAWKGIYEAVGRLCHE